MDVWDNVARIENIDAYASAMGAAAITGAATGTAARTYGTDNGAAMPWLRAIRLGHVGAAMAYGEAHGLPKVSDDAHGLASNCGDPQCEV